MICSECLWQEQTDPAVGIFMQIGAISLWLKRQLTEKNASNFRSSLCVSEASTQCWTDILLTFIFHQRDTHLLQLESTDYPNWRQMLLERLQQSLHEALQRPCTERGLCQHPACPTSALSTLGWKAPAQRASTERTGPTWKYSACNTKACSGNGAQAELELLPSPLSAAGIESTCTSVVRPRTERCWWKIFSYPQDNW